MYSPTMGSFRSGKTVSVVRRIFRQMSDLEKSVGFRQILSHFVSIGRILDAMTIKNEIVDFHQITETAM